MPITQDVYHEIVVDVDQRDYGVTVGEPPNIFLTEFRPGRTYNGAPPTYEGPSFRPNSSGPENSEIIVDINGQVMAEFPAGTMIYELGPNMPFQYGSVQPDGQNDTPRHFIRTRHFITEDGSEAGIFEVTLPPQRQNQHSRLLTPSEPQHVIVSVDRKQLVGRENIPFPKPELWIDFNLPDFGEPTSSSLDIHFDLLKSGDYIYVTRQAMVLVEGEADYRLLRQTAYWDNRNKEWILLQNGGLKPGDITQLSNGAMLINELEVNQEVTNEGGKLFRIFYLYQPRNNEPGFDLVRQWRLSDEDPADFVLSPEGRKLLVVNIDFQRFNPDEYMDNIENGYSIYLSNGSESMGQPYHDGQVAPSPEQIKIADLPNDYNGKPRITVSQDGNTVVVISQYSAKTPYQAGGQEIIPDFNRIHGKDGEQIITASILTVVIKGKEGQWYAHYVPLPEGWGMSDRCLLSWEPDGSLRISQFDNTKPEGEQWSHHYVNTRLLESGIMPYETFFVSDPTGLVFRNGTLTFTDSSGEAREFVVGYQPDDGRLDQLSRIIQTVQNGNRIWFTYNSANQTLDFGGFEALGFTGDWIHGGPFELVGVTFPFKPS